MKRHAFLILIAVPSLLVGAFARVQVPAPFEVSAKEEFTKSHTKKCEEKCFEASIDFPRDLSLGDLYQPWSGIDYKTESERYMQAVLAYVVEGNAEVDWKVQNNAVRKWYHAPWMHDAREPLHGLTSERGNRWHELSSTQERKTRNWAVGFYNPAGGKTMGDVWRDPTAPDAKKAIFPTGTVSAKLLFTDATDHEAPFLAKGANLEWIADIENNGKGVRLRLLQVDIAIKEKPTPQHNGWVFGTFMFDGSRDKEQYWENLVPVGLQWGNDPKWTYTSYIVNQPSGMPAEGWVNPAVSTRFVNRPPDGKLGYLGRMNGPVDNPMSSCLSCHSRAMDTAGGLAPAFTPSNDAYCISPTTMFPGQGERPTELFRRISNCTINEVAMESYFRNLKEDEPFWVGYESLDYSLQLALGIATWHDWFKKKYPDEHKRRFPVQRSTTPRLFMRGTLRESTAPTAPATEAFRRGD